MPRLLPATLTLILLYAAPSQAAMFCAGNGQELANALAAAAVNGQDDEIRIRTGIHSTPGDRFEVLGESGRALSISGGWIDFFGPCVLPIGQPGDTQLSAGLIVGQQVLRARTPDNSVGGSLVVSNLSLTEGRGLGANAGCMNINVAAGTMLVSFDRLALFDCVNQQTISPGALLITHAGTGRVAFRNSLIVNNQSNSGAAVFLRTTGNASVINFRHNTVANNSVLSQSAGTAVGVNANVASSSLSAGIELYDNAIVGNGLASQPDLLVAGTQSQIFAYSNVVSKPIQGSPIQITNQQIATPASLFAGYPGDLRPAQDSILRDSGNADSLPGLGNLDHGGIPRLQNGRVDVGTFEFEVETLFSSGFES